MSNYLAVATVTAALRGILRPAVISDVSGADVTIGRPQAFTSTPAPAVNIFLYRSQPHPAMRNEDLPTRRSDGSVRTKPRIPLQLDYLFTFYGDGNNLEPERLFAVTARTLHAIAQVSRDEIQDVVDAATAQQPIYPFLATTDLADQVELVKLTQLPLSLDEMSRLWALFPDIPYALSVAYQASVVVVEEDVAVLPAPLVQRRDVLVRLINRPVIESIAPVSGPSGPIVAGAALAIGGLSLTGPAGATVNVGGQRLQPTAAAPGRLEIKLPAAGGGPPAGPTLVRVTQLDAFGTPPSPRPALSSEPAVFLLQPKVTAAALAAPAAPDATGYTATFRVTCDIPVQVAQVAALLLTDPGNGKILRVVGGEDRTGPLNQLDFPTTSVPAGTYGVVLQVDGASSAPPPPTVTVP